MILRRRNFKDFHFVGLDDLNYEKSEIKQEKEITDETAPLEEIYFNAKNYKKFLPNKYFHNSEKGCQVKVVRLLGTRKGEKKIEGIYKICQTHNVKCSKTGWEEHHYLGRQN